MLEKVNTPPNAKWRKPKAPVVLAEGEATGHAHTVDEAAVEIFERKGVLYLKVNSPTPLRHQEHDTITIEPGIYRRLRQREWSDADEIRQVQD